MTTTDTWIGTSSADWGASAANWSTGFPNSNSNVIINTSSILTITYSGADVYVINSLAVTNDFFTMTGGSLTVLATASFSENFTQSGGTLTAGGVVTIEGTGTLIGGGAEGNTNFSITGAIALANYTLGGAAVLNNANVTNLTGQITVGDDTGINAEIDNKTGAVFDIAGNFGISQGAATASFVNAGTLEKTGGNGTSLIDINVTGGGAIQIATGSLEFRGPNNSFSGAISGAGQFALGGGSSDAIASGATIAAGTFGIYDNGTSVTLGENLSLAHAFDLEEGSTLNLAGHALTLTGTAVATFNNEGTTAPVIAGSGVLATASGSVSDVNYLTLGGTVNWQNSGTVNETAPLTIGDGSSNAAIFTNESGGVYNLTNDTGITRGAAATSQFVNASGGIFEKTAGTGNSTISVDMADSGGAVTVNTGIVEFVGPNNSFSGAISGAGQFALGGGSSDTIASGATIAAGTFGIYDNGTSVTLGENLSLAHAFDLEEGSTLNLGGHVLTLTGTAVATFNNEGTTAPMIDGSGALVTDHPGIIDVNYLTLGGTVRWQNSGTVNETAPLTIGDGSSNAASFTNQSGGVYNLTNDTGIARGAASTSQFINASGGIFEKTAGTGNSTISVDMADNGGAVTVNTGIVEFVGPNNSFSGAISGAGQFALGGGSSDTIASAATIAAGTFGIYDNGTSVTLGENLSLAHAFDLEEGSTLNLGGHTLTLTGTAVATFNNGGTTSPAIAGSGVLATASGSVSDVNYLTLGGTVNWQNSGTVNETAPLTIGDGSSNAAIFTNESGGVYNLTNDTGMTHGAAATSQFVNASGGIFEKTAGTGNSTISVDMADSGGAVTVNTGIVEFVGPNNSFSGAISGAGQFALGGGSSDTIASAATITAGTFGIYDNGTSVTLGENLSLAHAFDLEEGSTLNLGGHTLTLTGTAVATFNNGGTAAPMIDGSGVLVTYHPGIIDVNNLTLGGTVRWVNSGTVNETAPLTIGDGSSNAASFTNQSGGVYNLTNDTGIARGAAATSQFINASGGIFEKTAGTGDSAVGVGFINNGTVNVSTGEIEFQTTVSGTGTFNIAAGTVLAFDASVASGSKVKFLSTSGGELLLADSQQFRATISGFGGSGTDSLDLRDVNFNGGKFSLAYSGTTTQGVLTVSDGTHVAHMAMLGDYTTANFHASSDNASGTFIVDPPNVALALAR